MRLTRRAAIAAAGAALISPRALAGSDDAARVKAALDAAAAESVPARALALLEGLEAADLPLRLDLDAARAGLAIDAALDQASGETRYALSIRRTVGDVGDPAALRLRLQQELTGLHRRAATLFTRIGEPAGSVGARYSRMWRDPRFLYSDDEAGHDLAVADMRRTLAAARARVGTAFGAIPLWCLHVDVRALTAAEIAAGKGGYRVLPTAEKAGAYIVDLKDIRRRPGWTLPSVVAHELLPGHMVQLPIEALTPPHPLRLRYASAFVEGWGIYAEQLAAAQGAFAGDARAELGHVHWLLFRIGRALADIGMHLDGWSRDAAEARLIAWQGEPAYFAPFAADLDRIAGDPGTRVAEAMAWLAIADHMRGHSGVARARRHARLLAGGRKRIGAFANGGL